MLTDDICKTATKIQKQTAVDPIAAVIAAQILHGMLLGRLMTRAETETEFHLSIVQENEVWKKKATLVRLVSGEIRLSKTENVMYFALGLDKKKRSLLDAADRTEF